MSNKRLPRDPMNKARDHWYQHSSWDQMLSKGAAALYAFEAGFKAGQKAARKGTKP